MLLIVSHMHGIPVLQLILPLCIPFSQMFCIPPFLQVYLVAMRVAFSLVLDIEPWVVRAGGQRVCRSRFLGCTSTEHFRCVVDVVSVW